MPFVIRPLLLCACLLPGWTAFAQAFPSSEDVATSQPVPALIAAASPVRATWETIDAPLPALERAAEARPAEPAPSDIFDSVKSPAQLDHIRSEEQRSSECESGDLRGRICRVDWWKVLGESVFFLAAQHGGNLALDHDTRVELTTGDWWAKYVYCVEHYRWWRWKDDDPFGVDYVGHPMMGAFTSFIYEQNDPKQRAIVFSNTRKYWNGRLRAMAYSAIYSAQWKVGFASEASVGNTGIGYYIRQRDGIWTNETGMQDFFITPIGGLVWNVGEDIIDRYLFRPVIHRHKNKLLLITASLMTPMRAGANVSRFRAVYYRDLDEETATRVRQ